MPRSIYAENIPTVDQLEDLCRSGLDYRPLVQQVLPREAFIAARQMRDERDVWANRR